MKPLRPSLGVLLAVAFAAAPLTSEAANVRLGLGADYWIDESAAFNFTLAVEGKIAGPIFVGARFGASLITDGNDLGIPLDLLIRANIASARVYVEAMAGPWIVLDRGDALRAHAAFGFGLQGKAASIGVEVGYLDPNPIIGLKFGYRF
ncbi:hypothetical protein LZ198_34650 [Myxococcus sp. K15C18031901]|uniref:hypothetical protein n=1 Tax=Myxococcus dinghuensis TaxID=2906761 RepID=UPI0020A75BCB|nr:hypothetical protein [Myxococcus dinghuensis]MCP3104027.1 hypothetical protein [Myxococcus dinghuensis]